MSQFRGPRLGTSEFIGVELQRSEIRRLKGGLGPKCRFGCLEVQQFRAQRCSGSEFKLLGVYNFRSA